MESGALLSAPHQASTGGFSPGVESRSLKAEATEEYPAAQDEDPDVKLGAARMLSYLREHEKGTLHVETSSVYGVVLALPQIARTCGWPRMLSAMCFRGYLALLINFILQLWLIYFLNTEEVVMNRFGGVMNTCDFAANLANCPDGDGCVGPGGTRYTPSRLYDYGSWATRNYVRDSLRTLFPHMREEIDENVDPGEFGMENSVCRFVCVLIFVMSLSSELNYILDGFRLMYEIPTKAEPWVKYDRPGWADKDHVKSVHGWTELDLVKIKIAGMPLQWKIINMLLVLLPKAFLWLAILSAGATLLLNTAGIDNIIINSTALGFVLNIDELVCSVMQSPITTTILDKLEEFPLYTVDHHEEMDDDEAIKRHEENENNASFQTKMRSVLRVLPMNVFFCLFTFAVAIMWYYHAHCTRAPDGTWVSKDMRLPQGVTLSLGQALFPHLVGLQEEEEPYWSMPTEPAN